MRNLKMIIGACLLISTAGCAYYDQGYPYSTGYGYSYHRPVYYGYGYRPYGYHHYDYGHYDYGFWGDRRADTHG